MPFWIDPGFDGARFIGVQPAMVGLVGQRKPPRTARRSDSGGAELLPGASFWRSWSTRASSCEKRAWLDAITPSGRVPDGVALNRRRTSSKTDGGWLHGGPL